MVRGDGHSEQILCPPGRTGADVPGIVFIDFAFDALLNTDGTHATNDWHQLHSNLGSALDLSLEVKDPDLEELWLPPTEFEE